MKFVLLVLALTVSPSAFAKRLSHQAIGFYNTFNGVEAKLLYEALAQSGATVSNADRGRNTSYSIDGVIALSHSNMNLDNTNVCFKKPSFDVSFTDSNNENAKIEINEADQCNATKAALLVKALVHLGASEVQDCAMGGRCGFQAGNVFASRNLSNRGDDIYYAQVVVTQF